MDFKRDSYIFGGLIGLFLPIIIHLLIILIAHVLKSIFGVDLSSYLDSLRLLSVVINLLPMRYYLVKLKYDMTGRSILLVTFIYILVYFWVQ
jgi:hypothetical protein